MMVTLAHGSCLKVEKKKQKNGNILILITASNPENDNANIFALPYKKNVLAIQIKLILEYANNENKQASGLRQLAAFSDAKTVRTERVGGFLFLTAGEEEDWML